MLGEKLLRNSTCIISDDAHKQYVTVAEEIRKLCSLTHMSWDLTDSELFNAVRKISFMEGVVCGAMIVGGIVVARKIIKYESQRSEK